MPWYFNIPFPNHSGLVELQAYLRTKLPSSAEFIDPEQLHLTLVYVMEGTGVEDIPVPDNLPVFGIGGEYFGVFDTIAREPASPGPVTSQVKSGNRFAVTLSIEKAQSPQLVYLQSALFYALRAMGAVISNYSWPGLWTPHITLAYCQDEPMAFIAPTPAHLQVDQFVLTGEGYEVLKTYPLQTVRANGEPVAEMATTRDVLCVGEFAGSYPFVPYFPEVDIAALTKGDPDPKYYTLPIAEDDATSDNKRHYSAALVEELRRQVREKRPTGNQGHIPDKDRATAFPTPSVYWVGEAKVGKTVFGKAYIPPGETRAMVDRIKAVGGKLGTSLYAVAEMEWDAQRGVWNILPEKFNLEHIDLAPPDRMGIPSLAAVPHVTSEMREEDQQEGETMPKETEDKTPAQIDRTVVIREMTAEDAAILPRAVKDAVLESAPEKKLVAEMRAALNADESADLVKVAKELVAELGKLRQDVIVQEIKAQVDEAVKVESVRPVVSELVTARKPESKDKVAEIVTEIAGSDTIKALLKDAVETQSGPIQRRPGQKPGEDGEEKQPSMLKNPDLVKKAPAAENGK